MVTRSRSRVTSLLALLSVVFLLATACSDDSSDDASTETTAAASEDGATTTTAAPDAEPPSESAAASLRSDLVGLLEEQVYLTGNTVQAAVDGGGPDAPVAAAYAVEAGNGADDLANIIGGTYGVAAGDDFVAAWNDHREAIVDYGVGGGSADSVETARQGVLDAFADMDAEASFTGIADGLEASDEAVLSAVDAMVAGQTGAADLRTAADEMPAVGLDLATTMAAHVEVEGEVDSPESEFRSDLTGQLQESALLTGLGLSAIVRASGDVTAAGPTEIRAVIDQNTDELASTMEQDNDTAAAELADLWSGHIDAFEQYTTALVNDDAQGIQDSQDALVQFRDDVGELLAENHPGVTKEQVAEELVDHTDSMLAYADALVREAGDLAEGVDETESVTDTPSEAPALLRTAALNMRLAARSLALGLSATSAPTEEEAG